MGYGIALRGFGKALKKFRDKYMHEVPTGPHTDVRKYKINPSFKKKITGVGAGTKGGFGAVKRKPKNKKSRNF